MSTKQQPKWWNRIFRLADIQSGSPYPQLMTTNPNTPAGTPPDQQEFKRSLFNPAARGASGTSIYGGYIQEEYLTELQGYAGAVKYDEMRRSDSQLKMCLKAVTDSIKSATFDVEPGTEDEIGQMIADFVEYILFEGMDDTFNQFLGEALTMVPFGYSLHEMIDKVVVNHPEWGTHNAIKALAWRSQKTIHRFNIDPATGKLMTVTQYAYGDMQKMVDMNAENLLIFSLDREGANYEGISMLRTCYGNYFRKDFYLKMNAIGIERFAVPTPTVDVPAGAQGTDQYAALIEALEIYTTHQANYLTKPKDWVMTFNNGIYDPEKVEKSVDAEDRRMVKSFLANFLELGSGSSGGAYALSNDLSDFFLNGIKHVAGQVVEGLNKIVIPRMVKMNFGPQACYPTLKVSGIDDKIGAEFATMLKDLASSKYIKPDDQLEEHLRKRMGLPKVSLIGQREQPIPMAPGMPGAPPADPNAPPPKPGDKPEPPPAPTPPKPPAPKPPNQIPPPQPVKLADKIRLAEERRKLAKGG